jgi:hypothetical protein
MKYVVLAVASDAEADRLVQDLTENPAEPLHTPRWSNAVHATLATAPTPRSPTDNAVATHTPATANQL